MSTPILIKFMWREENFKMLQNPIESSLNLTGEFL